MRIGVISDTHIPVAAKSMPKKVFSLLAGVELILHAGDILQLRVIEELSEVAEIKAVRGNMDYPEILKKLPAQRIIQVEKFRIALVHGWGPPQGLISRLKQEFSDVDCIVYGHTHVAAINRDDNVLFFNPGSPTDKVFAPYNSIGFLEIDRELKAEIVRL